jgi:hypothetical protein
VSDHLFSVPSGAVVILPLSMATEGFWRMLKAAVSAPLLILRIVTDMVNSISVWSQHCVAEDSDRETTFGSR